jgi:hypothetical protein
MKTSSKIMMLAVISYAVVTARSQAQTTNYVIVSNEPLIVAYDDTAKCSAAFWAGLGIGGTVLAGGLVMWFVQTIPGGRNEEL